MRYLGCRLGVDWVSQRCRKFKVTVVCSLFGPKNSTLAIPLRYPCDGGGVEKLALCTNAYRSILAFAIPFQFFLFFSARKKFFRHTGVAMIKTFYA